MIPGFGTVKQNAVNAGADGVAISGSGPTIFAITNNLQKARMIEDAMVRTFKEYGIRAKSLITEVDSAGTRLLK